jgi:glycosyltransferase involved in cell wall biosynthesis
VTLGKKLLKDVDGKIVLFFGRPGVSKGLEYLIRAMTFVQDADAILVAITAHRDPRFPIMQRLVRELKLEKKVHFYDSLPRPDLIAAASAADVIVIPSVVEGFGFVAAESAVLGKPLVVSESGSLPEVVSGDVVFVRPSSPRSIASGIDRALTGATQHIPQKEFAWQDCIDATFAVYDQLLSHE